MKPNLLIFGGTGFVGKNFNRIFFNKYQIINTGSEVDVSNIDEVKSHIKKYDPHYVINLASLTTLKEVDEDLIRAYDVIFNGNKNILNSLNFSKNIRSYLYVSSSEVYDNSICNDHFIHNESSKVSVFSSNYARLKLLAENFCLNFKNKFLINIARPFTHIGPEQSLRFGYSKIINQLVIMKKTNQDLAICLNDIDSFRDITNVADICIGYEKLILSKYNKEIFNFCSSNKTSMKYFIKNCETILNKNIAINLKSEFTNSKKNNNKKNIGSYEKSLRLLNWNPRINLHDTIKQMVKYNMELHGST
jgi:GDP-4-dehydro-6-deoxy-D-mannose reductase